jgi:fumarylacetoacetase
MDASHDPERRSWVDSASTEGTDFPLQNLPLGVARNAAGAWSVVTAIGDLALDLGRATEAGLLDVVPLDLLIGDERLNRLLAEPAATQTRLRQATADLLDRDGGTEKAARETAGLLRPISSLEMTTPTRIGSFTDFYAGIHHAIAATAATIPGADIHPNYRWVPIAYHGRATTVRPSGIDFARPAGQLPRGDGPPAFGPCEKLDFELELGIYVGAGAIDGEPVPIARAGDHIAGYCLLNDWSARDVQRWEMWPLGPFLAKNFATTISPWLVTVDAMAPFRTPAMRRDDGDPSPLPYLEDERDQAEGGLGIELEVRLRTARMRQNGEPPHPIARCDADYLYWTPAQMVAHHTSGGCGLQPGDLLGTGTISGPVRGERGSLLEMTVDGREPVELPSGERRAFLEDGDEVAFAGRCCREGFVPIGFGECRATVLPAPAS